MKTAPEGGEQIYAIGVFVALRLRGRRRVTLRSRFEASTRPIRVVSNADAHAARISWPDRTRTRCEPQRPMPGLALVAPSGSSEKAVPEEHPGPAANCASWRLAKNGTDHWRSALPGCASSSFWLVFRIRATRLMRHRAHSFPIPGLSDCVQAPAAIGRLIVPPSTSERGAP